MFRYALFRSIILSTCIIMGLLALLSNNLLAQELKNKNHKVDVKLVQFETTEGNFTLKLFTEKAPITVANFLSYVDDGFYNNTIIHRVIPGFMIQAGGYTTGMIEKKSKEPIKNESGNWLKNVKGSVAMARGKNPDSATSQFFINLRTSRQLDAKSRRLGYTVFAEIHSGMDVVEKISNASRHKTGEHKNVPEEDIVIITAKRLSLTEMR